MKAAVIDRFGGPEEIYYTDIEKPVPGPDEVLVRNVYIGVGKPDYIMRSGICPFLEAKPPKLVVGNECAGIVEAVGSDVKGLNPACKSVSTAVLDMALTRSILLYRRSL